MDRKSYKPTKNQERKWAKLNLAPMPTDEEFKARWAKAHHNKARGWGMGKRNWIISNLKLSPDYQMGLWQGRVDAARAIEYAEERNDNTHNLGYYRGYTDYQSSRRGWDSATQQRFDEKYLN